MVRFGAKKVEAIPPFLFSTLSQLEIFVILFFINNALEAKLYTLTN